MKYKLTFFALFLASILTGQSNFPDFLQGVWKMENNENYEQWDKLNEKSMKGFAYSSVNGQIKVSEYLDISQVKNEIIYTATVLNQNNGKGVSFKLSRTGDIYTFENPNHDFPKKIVYQKLNDNQIQVLVTDGKQKEISYKLIRQVNEQTLAEPSITNPNYDAELAKKLGADDLGMKGYILVMLKTGANQTTDKDFISKCFRGHLDNINKMVADGKLVVAGPLGKNDKTYRGIFILTVSSQEEAKLLLQDDPAIKEGLLDAELFNWYGSAALPTYLDFSDKIWKTKP